MGWLGRTIKKGVYKVAGPAILRARKHFRPIVMMYHGVTRQASINGEAAKHVHISQFDVQLSMYKKYFDVVPLQTLYTRMERGETATPMLALTFDDGFENNHSVAFPALESAGVKATFFLATGYIGKSRWMWTDLLEYFVLHALDTIPMPQGNEIALISPRIRIETLTALKRDLKSRTDREVEDYLARVNARYGSEPPRPVGDYAFMDWRQVRELSALGHELGAHTVNHPLLSRIDAHSAEQEILRSRDDIMHETGVCSDIFCYPNGKKGDYTEENMRFIGKHFKAALSTGVGYADIAERYEIRRIGVGRSNTVEQLTWFITDFATR